MIIQLTDAAQVAEVYLTIKKIPFIDLTPEDILVECLAGRFRCFIDSGGYDGLCIVRFNSGTDKCHIVGVYAVNKVAEFRAEMEDTLRLMGVKTLTASSTRDPKAYERLTGFKPAWTRFSKEI